MTERPRTATPEGPGVDTRILERRREVRRSHMLRRRRRTLTVIAALVVLAALALVERSSLVALQAVEVVGVERLAPEVVREAASLPLGTSTLRLRLAAAEQRVERLPLVADADATRVDPLTVRITVTERVPALVATTPVGSSLLDVEGRVLVAGHVAGLPEITLPAGTALVPGDPAADHPTLANAVRAYEGLSGPLRARVVSYVAGGPDDLTLVLDGGVQVRFGRAERIDEKVRALGAILEDVGATEIAAIDVRAPATPVVEPA